MLFWLTASLACSVMFAHEALRQAFAGSYVAQDDVRQHVFWMERFLDPRLFPHDLIADYFQSIAPLGYSSLYRLMALLGLDPLVSNKLLPIALGLITTVYCFGLCRTLLPAPVSGFIGALLLNQSLWMQDDLASATPRAFFYPLFLAFLYYLARGSMLPCIAAIALQGLFYPSTAFVSAGVLAVRILRREKTRIRLSTVRRDYVFCVVGIGVCVIVVLLYSFESSGFGPVIMTSEARSLPEFSTTGRIRVFYPDFWEFWVTGLNTGVLELSSLLPFTICSGLVLPVVLRYPHRFPLAQKVSAEIKLFGQTMLASLAMFFCAHALLFELYLPDRYVKHSLRIVLSLAAGIALAIILDGLLRWCESRSDPGFYARQLLGVGSAALMGGVLFLYPGSPRKIVHPNYRYGGAPELYEFFSRQPEDTLIATLSREADKLPTFSKRSVLVSWETSLPYHKRYYAEMRQRAIDLIGAQYSPSVGELQSFVQKYRVDFLVVDQNAFTPEYVRSSRLMMLYPRVADEAVLGMQQGAIPALSRLTKQCSVLETGQLIVVSAECINEARP